MKDKLKGKIEELKKCIAVSTEPCSIEHINEYGTIENLAYVLKLCEVPKDKQNEILKLWDEGKIQSYGIEGCVEFNLEGDLVDNSALIIVPKPFVFDISRNPAD